MSIFHKNSEKGYNICKKFQIGSVILITQMTNQKKTELIDFFDLVWTKNPQFWKIFWKWKPFFPKTALKIVILCLRGEISAVAQWPFRIVS